MTPSGVRLTVLGSGSRGNAIVVESGATRVLVDVGFGPRTLSARLRVAGVAPESITGVVLTHEHDDHAAGALQACARWGWPLHATAETLAALPTPLVPVRTVRHGQPGSIGDFTVHSLSVPHDAADCSALVFEDRRSGARAGVVLDLGSVPDALPRFLSGLDLLLVEANHDRAMLEQGPYPWVLKRRIAGPRGHLSNADAADLVAACAHRGLRGVVLAHLSETNNAPVVAVDTVRAALGARGRHIASAQVLVASQRAVLGPVDATYRPGRLDGQCELAL